LKFKIQLTAVDVEIAINFTFSISLTATNKKNNYRFDGQILLS
jgi:hypothetical protein